MTRQRVGAVVATVVAAGVAAGGLVLMWRSFDPGDALYLGVGLALGTCAIILGWLVLGHAPANWVGALLCFMGLTPIVMTFTDVYASVLLRSPGVLPVSDLLVGLSAGMWMWLYVPPCLLLLIFPGGQLLGPRWRPVRWAVLGIPVAFTLLAALDPAPFPAPFTASQHVLGTAQGALLTVLRATAVALLAGLLCVLVASNASVVVRYRRSADVLERYQIRWLALAGLTVPLTLVLCWASYLLIGTAHLVVVGLTLVWLALPAATWVAISRHHLYAIDRLASATVALGLAVSTLLLAATALSVLLGVLVGGTNRVAVAGVTLAVAALLNTFRPRLVRVVDRVVYPARARVTAAVQGLAAAVREGQAQPEDLEPVLGSALSEADLRIEYWLVGSQQLVTGDGTAVLADVPPAGEPPAGEPPAGEPPARRPGRAFTPVLVGGDCIARIAGTKHTSDALQAQVAQMIAPLVELARLRLGLRASRSEAEAAQRRLQSATMRERRRLERDLHDGVQQRLVSLGMAMRLAQRHLPAGSSVDGVLDEAVAELATVLEELRAIAHGIRPIGLDDGLAAALAGQVSGSPIPVTMRVTTADLGDEVATAAYFVVTEALTNAVKHSAGAEVVVDVQRSGETLHIQIRDDGCGGADAGGAGLTGLADRVAALGGQLTVTSPRAGGTCIGAVLPCES